MIAAGEIAVALGMWDQESADRQRVLIEKTGLPTQLPAGIDLDAILASLQTDKKVKAGRVRFVLPKQIGTVTITDQVPSEVIQQVLEGMRAD
jgi:3-dehydroquinate synthase